MLENLKKKLGIVPNVEAEDVQETVTFSVTDSQEYKELLEGFTEQSAQLDAAVAKSTALEDKVKSLEAQLTQFAEQKVAAEAEAKKVKMDARLASLSKEVGDERAAKVLAATEGLDDVAFEAIASALKMSADNEANSTLFTEQGGEGEVSADALSAESAEMKILKEKYKPN
jgi:hypothetical protein